MVRFKNRYLLVEFRWHDGRVDATLTDAVVLGAIRQAVAHDFGDVGAGAAAAGLAVKYWSATTSLAVVRCGRDAHRRVWASMTMLRDVKGRAVVARVLHNASTLRSSRAATRSRVEAAFAARLVARGGMPGGASAAAAGTEAAKVAIDAMCE